MRGKIYPDKVLRRVSGETGASPGMRKSRGRVMDKVPKSLPNQLLGRMLLKEGILSESMSSRAQVARSRQQGTEWVITIAGAAGGRWRWSGNEVSIGEKQPKRSAQSVRQGRDSAGPCSTTVGWPPRSTFFHWLFMLWVQTEPHYAITLGALSGIGIRPNPEGVLPLGVMVLLHKHSCWDLWLFKKLLNHQVSHNVGTWVSFWHMCHMICVIWSLSL